MKTRVATETERYMSLPYTVVLRRDEDGDVVAKIEELPGCMADGGNEAEALAAIKEAQRLWLEEAIESGQKIPEPEAEEQLPSGKWVQRSPRTLHGRLTKLAKREGVSLNQLVTSLLTEAVASHSWTADRTDPEYCRSCPLNRAEIWDRAFEANQPWRFESTTKGQTHRYIEKLRKPFATARLEDAHESKEIAYSTEVESCAGH